jgi:3-phosphoglycerate kinase
MDLPKITDLDVAGKRVLLRLDLDTNPDPNDLRIKASEETLNYLKKKGCQIIILGHKGRPEPFAVKAPLTNDSSQVKQFGLAPMAKLLENIMQTTVGFIPEVCPAKISFEDTSIPVMLENLRFDAKEETNGEDFAKELANLGDIYINEAFASSHREHASIVALPRQMLMDHGPRTTAVGFRFEKEIENLSKVFENPERPLLFLISGLKEDKLQYIKSFENFADQILVGGRLPDFLGDKALESVRTQNGKVIVGNLTMDKEDITLNTIERFEKEVKKAKTIVVSGPLGKYEDGGHRQGTEIVLRAVIENKDAFKIAGGGDTEKALKSLSLSQGFNWISVGGGAMLEFLAKRTLPGLEALRQS